MYVPSRGRHARSGQRDWLAVGDGEHVGSSAVSSVLACTRPTSSCGSTRVGDQRTERAAAVDGMDESVEVEIARINCGTGCCARMTMEQMENVQYACMHLVRSSAPGQRGRADDSCLGLRSRPRGDDSAIPRALQCDPPNSPRHIDSRSAAPAVRVEITANDPPSSWSSSSSHLAATARRKRSQHEHSVDSIKFRSEIGRGRRRMSDRPTYWSRCRIELTDEVGALSSDWPTGGSKSNAVS